MGYLLGEVAQVLEFGVDRLNSRQFFVGIAFLGDELASDLGGTEAGIETIGSEPWISLTLGIDDAFDIRKQIGQMVFGALTSSGREGIDAGKAAFQLMGAFADGDAVLA